MMGVLWILLARIHFQALHNPGTQTIVHHHASHCMDQSPFWKPAFERLAQCNRLQTTGILAMPIVNLLIQAFTCDRNFISVDHHHEVAAEHMWGECRFMLATQNLRDLRCHATENLPLCIDDIPLRMQISGLGAICFHHCSLTTYFSGYSTRTRHSPCDGAADPGCVFSARCTIMLNSSRQRRFCPTSNSVPTILRTIPVRKASAVKSQ